MLCEKKEGLSHKPLNPDALAFLMHSKHVNIPDLSLTENSFFIFHIFYPPSLSIFSPVPILLIFDRTTIVDNFIQMWAQTEQK